MVLTVSGGLEQAASDAEWWSTVIERFGLPLAMLIIILVTGARGVWVFRATVERADKSAADAEGRAEKAEKERDDARVEIGRLQDERLRDAQRSLAGFGTRLHDTALLVEQGTRVVANVAPTRDELDELRADIRALTAGLRGSDLAGDRPASAEGGRGIGPGTGDRRGGRGEGE